MERKKAMRRHYFSILKKLTTTPKRGGLMATLKGSKA
jgi:hypothetical protein